MSLFPSNTEMNVGIDSILRERSNLIYKSNLKNSLVFSSISSITYYEHIEVDNNEPDNNKSRELINSFQLSYMNNTSKGKSVSRVANNSSIDRNQCVSNKTLVLMTSSQT